MLSLLGCQWQLLVDLLDPLPDLPCCLLVRLPSLLVRLPSLLARLLDLLLGQLLVVLTLLWLLLLSFPVTLSRRRLTRLLLSRLRRLLVHSTRPVSGTPEPSTKTAKKHEDASREFIHATTGNAALSRQRKWSVVGRPGGTARQSRGGRRGKQTSSEGVLERSVPGYLRVLSRYLYVSARSGQSSFTREQPDSGVPSR